MQLNITTDYSIRIILYVSKKGGIVTSTELSEQLKIPQSYVLKIAKKLSKAGYVKMQTGKNGGIFLAVDTKEISLLDILNVMENTVKINRCLEKDLFCSMANTETCQVHKIYCDLQRELEEKMAGVSIDKILSMG